MLRRQFLAGTGWGQLHGYLHAAKLLLCYLGRVHLKFLPLPLLLLLLLQLQLLILLKL